MIACFFNNPKLLTFDSKNVVILLSNITKSANGKYLIFFIILMFSILYECVMHKISLVILMLDNSESILNELFKFKIFKVIDIIFPLLLTDPVPHCEHAEKNNMTTHTKNVNMCLCLTPKKCVCVC